MGDYTIQFANHENCMCCNLDSYKIGQSLFLNKTCKISEVQERKNSNKSCNEFLRKEESLYASFYNLFVSLTLAAVTIPNKPFFLTGTKSYAFSYLMNYTAHFLMMYKFILVLFIVFLLVKTSTVAGITSGQSTGSQNPANSSLEERFYNVFTRLSNEVQYPFLQTGHYLNTALQVLKFLNDERDSDLILQDIPEEATFTLKRKTGSQVFPGKRKLAIIYTLATPQQVTCQRNIFLINLEQVNQESSCIKTSNFLKTAQFIIERINLRP